MTSSSGVRRSARRVVRQDILTGRGMVVLAVLALLTALPLTSCGGLRERPTTAPVEGTVVYHAPPTSRGSAETARREYAAATMIFTTAGQGLEEDPDQAFQVSVGERTSAAPVVSGTTQRAKGTGTPIARVLDRRRFALLWEQLEAAGLFTLPRHQGSRPSAGETYFMVKTRDRLWIYTRPRSVTNAQDEARRLLQSWRASILAIVNFANTY